MDIRALLRAPRAAATLPFSSGPKRALTNDDEVIHALERETSVDALYALLTIDPVVPLDRLRLVSRTLNTRLTSLLARYPYVWRTMTQRCFPDAFPAANAPLPPMLRAYIQRDRLDEPTAWRILFRVLIESFATATFSPSSDARAARWGSTRVTPPYVNLSPAAAVTTCRELLEARDVWSMFVVRSAFVITTVEMIIDGTRFARPAHERYANSASLESVYTRQNMTDINGTISLRGNYHPRTVSLDLVNSMLQHLYIPLPSPSVVVQRRLRFRVNAPFGGGSYTLDLDGNEPVRTLVARAVYGLDVANDNRPFDVTARLRYSDERVPIFMEILHIASIRGTDAVTRQRLADVFIDATRDADVRDVYGIAF